MIELLKWYLLFELIGWITFPICFRLFKNLRGKGFTFSKITGLLIWGYFYWIGNTFGIIENTRLSAIFILSLILAISLIIILKTSTREDLIHWIKDFRKAIVFWEILFFISVMFMVFMRGISPDILGTEKPMELAFINGIIRSPAFPPNDPWLSGYSISYYYFGYLIAAIVSKVIGSDAGFTFNLMIVFWFAMIAAESSAILFNLISKDNVSDEKKTSIQINQNLMLSLIAPVLLLIISNGEGLLELLHSLGVAWGENSAGEVVSKFWQWLDIRELTQAPPIPFNWNIQRPGAIWWWRASRVLQDYTIAGQPREIIDEFPFFSFYLADLHPHVLSMPFVLLCINYAFNMLVSGQIWVIKSIKEIPKIFRDPSFWFSGLTFGCLIFVNTWDFPIYFGLFSLILIIKNYSTEVDVFKNIFKIIPMLGVLGAACLLLYFPFLIGLSSQAGGLVPSLVFQTRSIHMLIMFSPFATVLFFYVAFSVFRKRKIKKFLITFLAVFCAYVVLLLISLLIPLIPQTSFQQSILSIFSAKSMAELINSAIVNIMRDPFDIILLLFMITFGITVIVKAVVKRTEDPYLENILKEDVFIGILVFISASLVLFP